MFSATCWRNGTVVSISSVASQPPRAGGDRNQDGALCAFIPSICRAAHRDLTPRMPGPHLILDHHEHGVGGCPGCVFVCEVRVLDFHKLSARVRDASKTETAWVSNFGSRMGVGGCADSICCREYLARQPATVPLAPAPLPGAGRGKHGLAYGLWIHGAFRWAAAGMPDISDHGSELGVGEEVGHRVSISLRSCIFRVVVSRDRNGRVVAAGEFSANRTTLRDAKLEGQHFGRGRVPRL